ncbi:hypothetical protein PBAL39_00445 [Pedobacter sp. BAL39]|uniref:hypothetical protein n=1 Tax=Pedobacter sp. BAL39 TaxID=391596 RepID=UPI0001559258|nr:hypothetical protein [Pedobacter sp. BAL39]EDM34955.1 hypothetical protein PBAL39_00445 [Pedobacter sp. BAL39]
MSLKTLTKTQWKIEQDRVLIYPHGLFHILAAVLAMLFSGLILVYVSYQNTTMLDSLPLVFLMFFVVLLFWAFAGTYIEFDNRKGRMRKVVMGVLPTSNIAFKELQGINVVSHLAGGYNYRLFRKDARYGKGIVVSSGYSKNDDPNAIAFVEEAVPVIHGYMDQHDSAATYVVEPITSYRFFKEENGVFAVKTKKIGAIIFALFFIGLGVWLLTIPVNGVMGTVIMILFMFLLGAIFLNAAFTRTMVNPTDQTIKRTGLLPFFNKMYHFENFVGIQTVRQSINFVYSGTIINMHFEIPGKTGKQGVFSIATRRRSSSIERFIQELYQIMNLKS